LTALPAAGSAPGGLGERLGRLGLRPGQDRSPAWFQLAAGLPADLLARLPGVHVKVTVAWPNVYAGDRASYAAGVAGWNTDQMPRLREPRIARVRRWCQQRVPGMLGTGPGWNATSARGT